MTIELTYTGGGYIPGVPARDLTTEEAAQHREVIEREQAASNTVLYVPVAPMQARRGKPEQPAGEVTNG